MTNFENLKNKLNTYMTPYELSIYLVESKLFDYNDNTAKFCKICANEYGSCPMEDNACRNGVKRWFESEVNNEN